MSSSAHNEMRLAAALKFWNKANLNKKMKVKYKAEIIFDLFHGCPKNEIVSRIYLLLQQENHC